MLTSALMRSLLVVLSTSLATCQAVPSPRRPDRSAQAQAQATAATSAPEEPPAAPREPFDPDVVRPRPGSPLSLIATALDSGDAAGAARVASAALASQPGAEVHSIWWMSARADVAAGTPVRAFSTLGNVAHSDHPLAPWARLRRAKMLLEVDGARAAEEVAPLLEMEWAGRDEAREVSATALVRAGRLDDAEPLLRAMLDAAPEGSAQADVALPLAELLAQRETDDAREEAIGLLRRVAMRAPLSRTATAAEARARELIAALPAGRRRALAEPSPAQAFERASALAAAMQHERAEEAFAEVERRAQDDALRCEARLGRGRAVYFRRQRARAAELLAAVARDCEAPEVRAWARYLSGKAYGASNEHTRAREQYARLEAEVPTHSLADDARYRSALLSGEDGDAAGREERLRTLPEIYPEGDMRGRARFILAWEARRAGDLAEALAQLEASLAEGTLEDREDLHGRAAYWRACVLAELGRMDEARAAWIDVVREHPLRYYAQQALVRLTELDPDAAAEARTTLGERGDGSIRFERRDELDSPAFARALALFRVGETREGRSELHWLASRGDAGDELRWVEAALLDRAGAHPEAVYVTRRHLQDFMERPPEGEHFARWRIAYPKAYASEIERAAATRPVPAELIFAIAREESSFRADAVSVAHAYGLTQLIVPTAQRFGRRIELRATARTLTNPNTNVQIGAEFMGWLWERYEANPTVLPSAYNAGQGATDRWLRERPDQRLDEWIEDIPYEETRRYTRRVLQSWGIYTWLDRGDLPTLAAALPRR